MTRSSGSRTTHTQAPHSAVRGFPVFNEKRESSMQDPLEQALTALAYFPPGESVGRPIHFDIRPGDVITGIPGSPDSLVVAGWRLEAGK